MAKNLVIVESPAKAKTIEKFLGKDYKVVSSYGHIRDLPERSLGVDVEKNFEPEYEIPADKKKVITELKKFSKESDTVWLASDEDREGEAIAWHLAQALSLDPVTTNRIVFHEITKNAIQRAIEEPRKIDQNLVNAQQARRVLDRLVGYELSPILWKKIRRGLSAGRVQSVAVRLIVERERAIENHKQKSFFRVVGIFTTEKGQQVKAELSKKFKRHEEAKALLESCIEAAFSVSSVEKKPGKRTPAAPFITSTLQQEASRKLGFSVQQTMTLAQRLYESGLITYMRTDSVNLSKDAVEAAKKEISSRYGGDFSQPRNYTSKTKGAQEAHEAIRPTYLDKDEAGADRNQKRLYELIWKRTIASQMADAQIERTVAKIEIGPKQGVIPKDTYFEAKGEVIRFEGFLKVYLEGTDDEDEEPEEGKNALPPLSENQVLNHKVITATQRFERPPARFTEASLVQALEKEGIGRPSTYAPTISTIVKRKYVEKGDREGTERKYKELVLDNNQLKDNDKTEITGAERNKLYPTEIGMIVNDWLVANFAGILDFQFTAKVEEEFDKIAEGELEWTKMLGDFHKKFKSFKDNIDEKGKIDEIGREIGKHPQTGKPIFAKYARYGKVIQHGDTADDEKPQFAAMPQDMDLNEVTQEQALFLLSLPKVIGEHKGETMKLGFGRFGPYVQVGKTYASLDKEDSLFSMNEKRGQELMTDKLEKAAKAHVASFETEEGEIQVLRGRFGPYIKRGRDNFKIPRGTEPESLKLEDCLEIIKKAGEAPAKKTGRGGAAAKKTTAKKPAAKKTTAKKSTTKKKG